MRDHRLSLSGCPASIDPDSYQVLLLVMADLLVFRDGEQQRARAHMLQETIRRLSLLLARLEREVTP